MPKSSLRKNQEKSVKTDISISFIDTVTTGSGIVETGIRLYVVPRKGEAMFQRILWTVELRQDPGDFDIIYAIWDHSELDGIVLIDARAMMEGSLVTLRQNWRSVTAVGVLQTSTTIEVDLKETVISRRSNLQDDDEFSIVPAYRSNSVIAVGQVGTLWVKETLFQVNFRDDLDEWAGYTFEESAS